MQLINLYVEQIAAHYNESHFNAGEVGFTKFAFKADCRQLFGTASAALGC